MKINKITKKDYKPFNITRIPIASEKDFYNDPIIKNTYKLGDNLEENRKKVFMGGSFRDVFTLQLTNGKPSAVTENERTFIILNGPSYRRVPPTNFKGFSPILADVQVNEVDKNGKKEVEIITVEKEQNYYKEIKKLFTTGNRYIAGYDVSNDVDFVNCSCRYFR